MWCPWGSMHRHGNTSDLAEGRRYRFRETNHISLFSSTLEDAVATGARSSL